MIYEKEIVKILFEAGDNGLNISKISHHVFNLVNSLFKPVSYSDIHKMVYRYVYYHSTSDDMFVIVSYGVYRLNKSNKRVKDFIFSLSDNCQNHDTLHEQYKKIELPDDNAMVSEDRSLKLDF